MKVDERNGPRELMRLLDEGASLHQVTSVMLELGRHLDEVSDDSPSLRRELRAKGELSLELARSNAGAALDLQRSIRDLMRVIYTDRYRSAERSLVVFAMTNLLTEGWLEGLTDRAAKSAVATRYDTFETTFRHTVFDSPAADHRLYTHLAEQATLEDLRYFVRQESTIDGNFVDLLAMAQIGTSGAAKTEVCRNMFEESGSGETSAAHWHLFNAALDAIGVSDDESGLGVAALACGNLFTVLARSRATHPECIGVIGATEALVPQRFEKVILAGRRLGLGEGFLRYYLEHVSADEDHSAGWLEHVIGPVVSSNAQNAERVLLGARLRLLTSLDYCEEVLGSLPSTRADTAQSTHRNGAE